MCRSRFLVPILALGLLGREARGADWSDTSLGYRYGTRFRDPGLPDDITKRVFSLTHSSGYRLGSHFFNVDVLESDGHDPSNGGAEGAQEVYVVYRTQLSLGKVTGRAFGFGPVKDVSLTAGFDFNAKNTAFAPKKRELVLGPTLNFDVKGGFFDLGAWCYRETNYNGIVGQPVSFRTTYILSSAWNLPFGGGAGTFKGYGSRTGAKGRDGFGVETRPETLLHGALLLDAGSALGLRPGALFLGLGYEYWNNKFGTPNDPLLNHPMSTPMLQMEWHF